ncbi:hypothetical protein U1Q18_018706, partial [Sarracenia purpurea var. burkii]
IRIFSKRISEAPSLSGEICGGEERSEEEDGDRRTETVCLFAKKKRLLSSVARV